MEQRNNIPVLAILGLSFTACPGGDEANPIVGQWNAVQLDGQKLPEMYTEGPYSAVFGLRLTVEDDLAGALEYYAVYDYGDYETRHSGGSDLVVDDSGAPKYRVEVANDLFGGDIPYYYDTVGTAVSSDGYDNADYVGDGEAPGFAAAPRPIVAPAELVLTCTLEQDVLTCAGEDGSPKSLVFKRQKPVDD